MKTIRIYFTLCLALIAWTMPAKAEKLDYPLDTINGQVYYRYTVERSVGLYRISVNFGVTQEEILKANPHLQHQGLRYEEVILIPAKGLSVDTAATPVVKAKSERSTITQPTRAEKIKEKRRKRLVLFDDNKSIDKEAISNRSIGKEAKSSKKVVAEPIVADTLVAVDTVRVDSLPKIDSTAIRLALLLPLHADAIKREKNMERFYDFYAGALIAIYEAQAKGHMLEVFTYDIGKTANRTNEVLSQHPEIRQMDAVIGPAYSQQVAMVMDSLAEDSVRLLIPFLSRVEGIQNHPNVYKFNPSEQIEADTIARYLAQKGNSINCVLIESKDGEVIPSGIKALHAALKREQVPTTTISLRALLTDSIGGGLRSDVENIVVFNTERYANLQTVMPHLIKASANYRITLYSHYSWQSEKIILPQLYVSVFTQEPFVPQSYQALFDKYFAHELSSEQPRYDLLGYDLTSHLLQALHQQKSAAEQVAPTTLLIHNIWEGVQSNIRYQQTTENGGYENHLIHIIHQ